MSDVVVVVQGSDTAVTVSESSVDVAVTETDATVTISDAGPQGSSYPLGDPIYSLVRNATGATLTKGTVVYTSGANGTHVQVTKAQANSDATSARTMGFISADIANGADGYVVISGYLTGLDTAGTTAGDIVYLSPTTAGAWTTTKPYAPNHLVYLGVITRVNANNGSIFVHPQNGYELNEIHDVAISSPTNNQVLTYESASGLWKNKTGGSGITSLVAESPLTGGTVTSAGTVGLDQTALSITRSQVSDFTSGTVAYATSAGSASTAGTATYATTSGTASYATTSGTAVSISGSITESQVTNLVTDLDAKAPLYSRHPFGRWVSGGYYKPAIAQSTFNGAVANTLYYTPITVQNDVTLNGLTIYATAYTSGTPTVRLGIYSDSNGYPSTLVLDAGTVSVTSTGQFTITISQALSAGRYWFGFVVQTTTFTTTFFGGNAVTTPTWTASSGAPTGAGFGQFHVSYSQTGVTGALPTTPSSSMSPVNAGAWGWMKVA